MRFEIIERCGLARTGLLEIDNARHPTPTLAYADALKTTEDDGAVKLRLVSGRRIGAIVVSESSFVGGGTRSDADAMISTGYRGSPFAPQNPKGDFAVLENISKLMLDSSAFVTSVKSLKSGEEVLKPLFCPVAGSPNRLASLSYCGVDVFDTIPIVMASETDMYLTSMGTLDYGKLKELPCSCEACSSRQRGKDQLLRHNIAAAESELKLVRHSIEQGTLRELVEARARTEPWLVQNLRLMDHDAYELQEMYQPVRGSPFHAGSKESLTRPDVVRWQQRLKERYRRPESARILVLIPCSAKKPYSLSRSHMRFREAIAASGGARSVHEVIVTSPLGIVPRELELFYPAKEYDIPVTGHWDRDETSLVQDMVRWLVSTQAYDLVISHLGVESDHVATVLPEVVDTSMGNPGSRHSLERLTAAIGRHCQETDRKGGSRRLEENVQSVCRYQLGPAGDDLCRESGVVGRWPNLKLVRHGVQLGMLTGERGMVSLTMAGGQALASAHAYCVEIDDFVPKGNLFAVGVDGASPEIRVGDDVAVVHRSELRAVGVARMCSAEMSIASRGEAVHIRHVL